MGYKTRTAAQKVKQFIQVGLAGSVGFTGICLYKADQRFYSGWAMPALQTVLSDGESAHEWGVWAAEKGLMVPGPKLRSDAKQGRHPITSPTLATNICGIAFPNPVGLAAGFDKDGRAVSGLHSIGFGSVEIGSVTPLPQPGNPRPRVFRLVEDKAVINRYGFNSEGHEAVLDRVVSLRCQQQSGDGGSNPRLPGLVLGINLGKNKESPLDSVDDYVKGVKVFAPHADYLVINVSSPNTKGLRNLQEKSHLEHLIQSVMKARDETTGCNASSTRHPPILLKIAPDLSQEDKKDIAGVVLQTGVEGLIVSNTTVSRPDTLKSRHAEESGGLSGHPLKEISTAAISDMYLLTGGKVPILGVGGVASGSDAFDKIAAGASAIQVYSAFAYHGTPLPATINTELEEILRSKGFKNISEAVGSAHKS